MENKEREKIEIATGEAEMGQKAKVPGAGGGGFGGSAGSPMLTTFSVYLLPLSAMTNWNQARSVALRRYLGR